MIRTSVLRSYGFSLSQSVTSEYPTDRAARDRWILALRPARNNLREDRPVGFFLEDERAESGEVVPVATIFLTNRECPWRCLMCDLWKNTLPRVVSRGAIAAQIDYALEQMPRARHVKLYNSGSFFDPRAIPPDDYADIARRLQRFERVIVECHPLLIGQRCFDFQQILEPALEVAMGLETAHPATLQRLNKGMTIEDFQRAAKRLSDARIALRTFVLVKPPFLAENEALVWAKRSVDFAFDCGSGVVCLLATRGGNGALEALAKAGHFAPPKLTTLESVCRYGVLLRRGRVFADLWDLEKFSDCPVCFEQRRARLQKMNLEQEELPSAQCESCQRSVHARL